MKVQREVAKDLLPLYVAGEASEESREAVEEWLRSDAGLARLAAELREDGVRQAGSEVSRGAGAVALAKTKALLRRRAWLLGLALLFTGLPLSFSFDSHRGLLFFMLRDAPSVATGSLAAAIGFWIAFAAVARRLRVTGL